MNPERGKIFFSYSNIYPKRCNVTQFLFYSKPVNSKDRYTVYFIWKLLYMFWVVPPPIIRIANNCIYSIWYIAAGSSNGVTNTRCCRYCCLRSGCWVVVPPETCRAVSRSNKLCNIASCWIYILEYVKTSHLTFMGPCIVIIFQYIYKKIQRYTVYFIWKLLSMFRVVLPPIIRSAYNCIYSIWYLLRHPQHTQTSSNSSTIAADSSNGVTNTRCCRYSRMRS